MPHITRKVLDTSKKLAVLSREIERASPLVEEKGIANFHASGASNWDMNIISLLAAAVIALLRLLRGRLQKVSVHY